MTTPLWALAAAYWLHMLATVLWIGGLIILALVLLPAAQKTLDMVMYARLLEDIRRRLDPLGWLCILILLASGMFQMSASPHYTGFLAIEGLWSGSILAKHLLFGLMILTSGYATWGLMPALRREALLQSRGKGTSNLEALQMRSIRLMQLNLALGIFVLLLTSIARAS